MGSVRLHCSGISVHRPIQMHLLNGRSTAVHRSNCKCGLYSWHSVLWQSHLASCQIKWNIKINSTAEMAIGRRHRRRLLQTNAFIHMWWLCSIHKYILEEFPNISHRWRQTAALGNSSEAIDPHRALCVARRSAFARSPVSLPQFFIWLAHYYSAKWN